MGLGTRVGSPASRRLFKLAFWLAAPPVGLFLLGICLGGVDSWQEVALGAVLLTVAATLLHARVSSLNAYYARERPSGIVEKVGLVHAEAGGSGVSGSRRPSGTAFPGVSSSRVRRRRRRWRTT